MCVKQSLSHCKQWRFKKRCVKHTCEKQNQVAKRYNQAASSESELLISWIKISYRAFALTKTLPIILLVFYWKNIILKIYILSFMKLWFQYFIVQISCLFCYCCLFVLVVLSFFLFLLLVFSGKQDTFCKLTEHFLFSNERKLFKIIEVVVMSWQ